MMGMGERLTTISMRNVRMSKQKQVSVSDHVCDNCDNHFDRIPIVPPPGHVEFCSVECSREYRNSDWWL